MGHERNTQKVRLSETVGERKFQCNICDRSFARRYRLKEHVLVHTGERPFPCDTCGKAFRLKSLLQSHQSTHSEERPHSCRVCGRSFKYLTSLKNHEETHTEKLHVCPHCHFQTPSANYIHSHIRRIHKKDFKHDCSLCGRSFLHPSQLQKHVKKQHGVEEAPETADVAKKEKELKKQKHQCTMCDYSADYQSQLGVHLLTHSGVKPHQCDFCNRRFTQNGQLKLHLRIHTGERPFVCPVCKKGFARLDNLSKHKKTHAEKVKQLHPCELCGRTFNQKYQLKIHLQVHLLQQSCTPVENNS